MGTENLYQRKSKGTENLYQRKSTGTDNLYHRKSNHSKQTIAFDTKAFFNVKQIISSFIAYRSYHIDTNLTKQITKYYSIKRRSNRVSEYGKTCNSEGCVAVRLVSRINSLHRRAGSQTKEADRTASQHPDPNGISYPHCTRTFAEAIVPKSHCRSRRSVATV